MRAGAGTVAAIAGRVGAAALFGFLLAATTCSSNRRPEPGIPARLWDGAHASRAPLDGLGDPALPRARQPPAPLATPTPRLTPFSDAAGLHAWLARVAEHRTDAERERVRQEQLEAVARARNGGYASFEVQALGRAAGSSTDGELSSITNNQVDGVDEGDIVKTHGDHLVVLRRGRLFAIDLAGGAMRLASVLDVAPDGGSPDDWYDEMLVRGDTIVVIGFSSGLGGTVLGLFHVDDDARITRGDWSVLRSSDYYSTSNYASRLVGSTLVLYLPYPVLERAASDEGHARFAWSLPGLRADLEHDWSEIVDASAIYEPIQGVGEDPTLHAVVTCELDAPRLACRARGVLGPAGREVYVGKSAVYVWVADDGTDDPDPRTGGSDAVVYRLPLGGGSPGAVRVAGAPIDQLSFHESEDGSLYVLVRAGGDGRSEDEVGLAVARIAVSAFGADAPTLPASRYAAVPRVADDGAHNRFVGDWLLYGAGTGWGEPRAPGPDERLHLYAYRTGRSTELRLPHVVDRVEVMGRDAVVVGSDGHDLHFTAVALDQAPRVVDSVVQPDASQGETRTHGFFYAPTSDDAGWLGLAVRSGGELVESSDRREGSAEVLFLSVRAGRFTRLGALRAGSVDSDDDACVASCTDWYGNARPIFYRGRTFGLLGYELVEGRLGAGRTALVEVHRVDFLAARRR